MMEIKTCFVASYAIKISLQGDSHSQNVQSHVAFDKKKKKKQGCSHPSDVFLSPVRMPPIVVVVVDCRMQRVIAWCRLGCVECTNCTYTMVSVPFIKFACSNSMGMFFIYFWYALDSRLDILWMKTKNEWTSAWMKFRFFDSFPSIEIDWFDRSCALGLIRVDVANM